MKVKKSQGTIHQAIDLILTRGGHALYDRYLTAKLPPHAQQYTRPTIENIFRQSFHDPSTHNKKLRIKENPKCNVDTFAPNRIKIKRKSQSQFGLMPKKVPRSPLKPNVEVEEPTVKVKLKPKPGFSIKFLSEKTGAQIEEEEKMRKKIEQNQQNKQGQQRENRIAEAQKKSKQKQIQKEYQQLKKRGPVLYNDEGKMIRVKKDQRQQYEPEEVVELNYYTIDFEDVANTTVSERKSLTGRKKGFYSCPKFGKKARITNEIYNNNHDRQFTSIPFLNLCQGTKIVEKNKDVTASKNRQPLCTREQFIKQNESTMFKSFMPDFSDQISAMTIRSMSTFERPNTTGNFRQSKRTTNTGFLQTRSKKSILWRPKTTEKGSRVTVENENLAKGLTVQ